MLKVFAQVLDLIFENSCMICNQSSEKDLICKACEISFKVRSENSSVKSFEEITVYSWGLYDSRLRDGIIALKAGKKKLANCFAEKLICFWKTVPEKVRDKNYLVIPIPSHKQRIKERGYCQTTLITSNFTKALGLNFSSNLIIRIKQTKHMNSLSDINERKENIKNAFELTNPADIKDILIIDDILTSGSTLCEVAKIIHKNNPGANIVGLTVAAGDRYSV